MNECPPERPLGLLGLTKEGCPVQELSSVANSGDVIVTAQKGKDKEESGLFASLTAVDISKE